MQLPFALLHRHRRSCRPTSPRTRASTMMGRTSAAAPTQASAASGRRSGHGLFTTLWTSSAAKTTRMDHLSASMASITCSIRCGDVDPLCQACQRTPDSQHLHLTVLVVCLCWLHDNRTTSAYRTGTPRCQALDSPGDMPHRPTSHSGCTCRSACGEASPSPLATVGDCLPARPRS